MHFGQFLMLYLLLGLGVAGAVFIRGRDGTAVRSFHVMAALLFWPLFVPILLAGAPEARAALTEAPQPPNDELTRAISQADAELAAALKSLDGWAEGALAREKERLSELREAWNAQARRIRDMDRVLAGLRNDPAPVAADATPATAQRIRASQQSIRDNFDRLEQVRRRSFDDLIWTLAWVCELASMIHLAKFTGAPASRAEELVAQIAAAVEGLSALTWKDEAACAAALSDG